MAYHISPTLGPRRCRATIRPCRYGDTYEGIRSAREAFSSAQSTEDTTSDMKSPQEVIQRFSDAGFWRHCHTVQSWPGGLPTMYHESLSNIEGITVRDITGTLGEKPSGGLWVSPMSERIPGMTSWNEFWHYEWGDNTEEEYRHEVTFKEDAVILELTEQNVRYLPMVSDDFADTIVTHHIFNPRLNIDFVKLKEHGIDIVYVNGETERTLFYGWDVESAVILNGEAVEKIEKVCKLGLNRMPEGVEVPKGEDDE